MLCDIGNCEIIIIIIIIIVIGFVVFVCRMMIRKYRVYVFWKCRESDNYGK